MIRVGLTGGYGTGKSTVTRMFGDLGAATMDADDVVHALLSEDRGIIDEVAGVLGRGVLAANGSIDRGKVADVVFDDEKALASLTGVLYPGVRERISEWFKERRKEGRYLAAIAEVSMLIEGGALELYDKVVLVIAAPDVQRQRCLAEGISAGEFARRVRNQMPLEKKTSFADYMIDNSGALEESREQVLDVWNRLKEEQRN
jgi:dephospho-CoA kinase